MGLPVVNESTPAPQEKGGPGLAPKRVFVETHGCQMNAHDSERLLGLLAQEGYMPTPHVAEADLVVLNSCSIREKAEQKVLSAAGTLKPLKEANPNLIVAVGGCVAQQEGKRLLARAKHIDLVFGPDHVPRIGDMVREIEDTRNRQVHTRFVSRNHYTFPPVAESGPAPISSYVSVMKGCDKFCTYCVVPYTRGREVSRPAEEILAEVRTLARRGSKEIVLLGQTVNSYGRKSHPGEVPFETLLAKVAAVDGVQRVRFTSPHPSDFSAGQIRAFRDVSGLCAHMHLPVQSGSDRVLKAMRRDYDRNRYLNVVNDLKRVAPEVALTTDVIVGFPGESRTDFEDTLSLLETVRFQASFSFAYSERKNTKAIEFGDVVPPQERMSRLREFQALQDRITRETLDAMVGSRHTVMIEGPSKTNKARSSGRTEQNRLVHLDGVFEVGAMVEVEVVEAFNHSVLGVPCQS